MYQDYTVDPNDLKKGLLRSKLLVQVSLFLLIYVFVSELSELSQAFKAVFFGPRTAIEGSTLAGEDSDDIIARNVRCGSNAARNNIASVTMPTIAYITTLVRPISVSNCGIVNSATAH